MPFTRCQTEKLRHNRKRAIAWSLNSGKEKWYMQNHPKIELYMRLRPQMRNSLQLFWSIVTINVFSTIVPVRSMPKFFSHLNAIDAMIWFLVGLLTRGMLLMKKRRRIGIIGRGRVGVAFCNRPKPKMLLLKNEFMIKWIEWKAGIVIVEKYIFRPNVFRP